MKKTKTIALIASLFVAGTMATFAGNKTEQFLVNGKCGSCEKRIEKAAQTVDGVSEAHWDQKTKKMAVSFDDQQTSMKQIETAIAMTGHDTQLFRASNVRYNELPACCHYERNEIGEKTPHTGMKMDCENMPNATKKSCCEKE
ncbi:MAG TPA: cation transporter [Sunxiuqinia sp.]|nr:cation transporter [Sunxiuqinia sp.]